MTTLHDLIYLNPDVPAFDPLLLDCTGMDLAQFNEMVHKAMTTLVSRLRETGFSSFKMIVVVNSDMPWVTDIDAFYEYPHLTLVPDDYCPTGTVYLLTIEVESRPIIHPPWRNPNEREMMTWEEYFIKIMMGEPVKIMVDMPWAQARFTNVFTSQRS